jgi:hypothetical protein
MDSNQTAFTLDGLMKGNPDLAARNPSLTTEDGPKRSKYGNRRTEYGGMMFDSQREASRAVELDMLKRAGEVLCWTPHVVFPLAKGVSYEADFVIVYTDWHVEVEDTKGFRTKEYRIKKKLFAERYGREIIEV